MTLKLRNGKATSEHAIRALEAGLGYRISNSFTAFVKTNDGAEPETNIFRLNGNNDCGVNAFIPVDEILRERALIGDLPERAYPVAWAECGNYVFVDEARGGAVYFLDHELRDKSIKLAESFDKFLDLLQPFDIKTVPLNPSQVMKAWIDAEFLERLKKSTR